MECCATALGTFQENPGNQCFSPFDVKREKLKGIPRPSQLSPTSGAWELTHVFCDFEWLFEVLTAIIVREQQVMNSETN